MAGVSQIVYEEPKYCFQDGNFLVNHTYHRFRGYDLQTGRKNPEVIEQLLVCSLNPDFHPRWTRHKSDVDSTYWRTLG